MTVLFLGTKINKQFILIRHISWNEGNSQKEDTNEWIDMNMDNDGEDQQIYISFCMLKRINSWKNLSSAESLYSSYSDHAVLCKYTTVYMLSYSDLHNLVEDWEEEGKELCVSLSGGDEVWLCAVDETDQKLCRRDPSNRVGAGGSSYDFADPTDFFTAVWDQQKWFSQQQNYQIILSGTIVMFFLFVISYGRSCSYVFWAKHEFPPETLEWQSDCLELLWKTNKQRLLDITTCAYYRKSQGPKWEGFCSLFCITINISDVWDIMSSKTVFCTYEIHNDRREKRLSHLLFSLLYRITDFRLSSIQRNPRKESTCRDDMKRPTLSWYSVTPVCDWFTSVKEQERTKV